jgi:hypothetical protein
MADKVALGQAFLQILQFATVSISPAMLCMLYILASDAAKEHP